MRLALLQNNQVFAHKQTNIKAALALMASVEADLYILPELFATGYNFTDVAEVRDLSERYADGQTFYALWEHCQQRGCYCIYGFPENDDGRLYNSAALIGPEGAIGLYRKMHLYYREKLYFERGNIPFAVYELPFGRVGMMICFDWFFPECARTLMLRGAQLVAHPANLVGVTCQRDMPLRARENHVFVATADRVGTEDRGGYSFTYTGESQIIAPLGEILARASAADEEIIVCEIDLAQADDKSVTEYNDILDELRPEQY